jgi:hypothetical protein
LSGCYWIQILSAQKSSVLVENLADAGKKEVQRVRMSIESNLVFPLLRGRDVLRWSAEPRAFIIAPQDEKKHREGIAESAMKRTLPKTYAYLNAFRAGLTARADRKYYPLESPFYTMRNVADYTRHEWKVVFKDLSETLQCAVIGPAKVGGEVKPVFPDLTLRLIPVGTKEEAHFVAAVLNSSPCIVLLHCSSVGVQTQRYHPSDIEKVAIPKFDPKNKEHIALSHLAQKCELAAKDHDADLLGKSENEIDEIVGDLWGIAKGEMRAIRNSRNAIEQ